MAKYTNIHALPPHMVALLTGGSKWNAQKTNRLRVTQTGKPIRQLSLMYKRLSEGGEEEPEDVLALANRTLGTIVHKAAEDALVPYDQLAKIVDNLDYYDLKPNSELSSKGMFVEVPMYKKFGDMTLSGKADIIWDGVVRDIKTSKNYAFNSDLSSYIWQLSVYRMMRPDIITKPYGYLDFFFKDGGREATKNSDAINQVECLKVDLYPIEAVKKVIQQKVDHIAAVKKANYTNLENYMCPDEHVYFKKPEYKAMKVKDGKRSVCTSTDIEVVEKNIAERKNPNDYKIVKVTGAPCVTCPDKNVCQQYATLAIEGDA